MDITIQSISDATIDSLRAAGYKESTIKQYIKMFRELEDCSIGGICTEESLQEFVSTRHPDGTPFEINYQRFRERIARVARTYATYGDIDLSVAHSSVQLEEPYTDIFADLLLDYKRSNRERGLAESTCNYYERLAREYLVFLESDNVKALEQMNAASILDFMSDISKRWPNTTTYHLATNFRPFLRYLKRPDLVNALKLTNPTREHRIVPMLTDSEEEAIVAVCCSNNISAGEAAITLLALTTGMRSCDIIKIEIDNIDWRLMTLTIVQQKTGNPLTVPLQARLAEALARYLLEERPDSDFPQVFIRQKSPHTPFRDHAAIYAATKRTMEAAGVVGGGSRLLRHNAASRMLKAGAELPVISAVLGHADPDSTNVYMEADESAMVTCVLPLPKGAWR